MYRLSVGLGKRIRMSSECTVCLRVEVVTIETVDGLLLGCSAAVERKSKVPVVVMPEENSVYTFDVHMTVHRRHSEGKEPTRCDKACSFYCLNMFRAPICPSSGVQLEPGHILRAVFTPRSPVQHHSGGVPGMAT
jgi:hypothetical protein